LKTRTWEIFAMPLHMPGFGERKRWEA